MSELLSCICFMAAYAALVLITLEASYAQLIHQSPVESEYEKGKHTIVCWMFATFTPLGFVLFIPFRQGFINPFITTPPPDVGPPAAQPDQPPDAG